jgi:hypothetical protein
LCTSMSIKNVIFWDVMSCGSCKNRRFRGTLVLTRATWCNIPEDSLLHSHHCENLKSYILGHFWNPSCTKFVMIAQPNCDYLVEKSALNLWKFT